MTDDDPRGLPPPPPTDGAFLLLLALSVGERFEVRGGELHVTLHDGPGRVPQHCLDDLEARRWVELVGEDGAAVTEQGKWHLAKWLRRKVGRNVRFTGAKLTRAAA